MSKDCSKRDNPPYDGISTLPNEIRLRILALLPGKDAIRTSVLSTQWRNLWKFRYPYNTYLEFMKKYTDEQAQVQFVGEINRHMESYREKKIERFSLSFNPSGQHEGAINEWIKQAISCGVEEFYLDFSQGLDSGYLDDRLARKAKRPTLTEELFKDNMLTMLHLSYCTLHRTFKFKSFGCLETLHLHAIRINDAKLERAIANCMLLRTLNLNQCMLLHHLKVKGPELKLKWLLVANCWELASLAILAPNLESIHLTGKFPSHYAFIDISSLVCVNLSPVPKAFYGALRYWMRPMIAHNPVGLLSLCGSAIQQMIDHEPIHPIMLSNVKKLCLSIDTMVQFDVVHIYKLLKKYQFPQLQVLPVQFPAAVDDLVAERFLDALKTDLLDIGFERLKSLQLNNFHVSRNHIDFLNYILERAVSLAEVTLVVPFSYRLHESESFPATLIDGLEQKQKASATAKISVMYSTSSGGIESYPSQVNRNYGFWNFNCF